MPEPECRKVVRKDPREEKERQVLEEVGGGGLWGPDELA